MGSYPPQGVTVAGVHETCLEYLARRLSEGWKVIALEYPKSILLSPEGITRPLDLRNDVETLRPNAAGDYTNIASQFPVPGAHWDKVDETPHDGNSTYVYTASTTLQKDAYALQDTNIPAGSTINSVKVYFRCDETKPLYIMGAKPFLRLGTNETAGTEKFVDGYSLRSETLSRPGGGAWSISDLNNLQVAIGIRVCDGDEARCTQVYVEVDYTLDKISGVVYTPHKEIYVVKKAGVRQDLAPPTDFEVISTGTRQDL